MTAVATQPAVWQELQRCFDDQDYDKMLLLCDKSMPLNPFIINISRILVLLQSPGDLLAIECRLQALTALSKYNAVIRAFSDKQKHPIPADIDRKFLAYAFYKVNKLSEALQVIEALPGGHREQPPVKHLEAQIVCHFISTLIQNMHQYL
jgi:hypothetical protein